MADSVVVIAHAAQTTGIGTFSFRGKVADPFAEPDLLTVADAFTRFAGIDLLATIPDGRADREALAAAAVSHVRITGGRHMVGYFQQGSGRTRRAESGAGPLDDPLRVSRAGIGAGAREAVRSAGRGAFRDLRLRRRTRERFRRVDRRGRTAAAFPRRQWTRRNGATANAIRSTRNSLRRWHTCRRRAGWRWVSTVL